MKQEDNAKHDKPAPDSERRNRQQQHAKQAETETVRTVKEKKEEGKRDKPGPDSDRRARQQEHAEQAEILRTVIFPGRMAAALGLDSIVESPAYRIFLDRLMDDAGNPNDPIERMLLEQLTLAHFRIADLHVGASTAKGIEAMKIYNSGASRLLGEFRRTALALRCYRSKVPDGSKLEKLKIYKQAQ